MTTLITKILFLGFAFAGDGPSDNRPESVRPIPPLGIAVEESQRKSLAEGVEQLRRIRISAASALETKHPELVRLLADVDVLVEAVERTLETGMFYRPGDVDLAKNTLQRARQRLDELGSGRPEWATGKGPIARGYRSRIDGSLQPYGIVVPETWQPVSGRRHRLDIWFHGRGEKLSEVDFINQRSKSKGEFAPADAFVLHPYGRYNNANRFAGEVDTFEALADVCKNYPIDRDRIAVRGFSMGGAACWQFATHHPCRWAAAAPGAGFSETPDFLKVFQNETLAPTWWEKKLWRLYDATDYALNLKMVPTVAYSGDIDKQRQAAEIMISTARDRWGIDLVHIIGPNTGHKYEAGAKAEIARRIDAIVEQGRDAVPEKVHFATFSLRYADAGWIRLDGLVKHWEESVVEAVRRGDGVEITTKNVAGLSIHFEPGHCPFGIGSVPWLRIDGIPIKPPSVRSDRSWDVHFRRVSKGPLWRIANDQDQAGLRKQPGLQGPIDDAFMDAFVFVRPTGKPMHAATGAWVNSELERAARQWLLHFRGKPPIVDDIQVNDETIRDCNLVCWGDPQSNSVIAKTAAQLPLVWTAERLQIAGAGHAASGHMPILIYPNPRNPRRYIVLNSGFTFREYAHLNNARQTPKLPDFAIVDLSTPPDSRWPGKIAVAGFFNERWLPPTKWHSESN